MNKPLPRRVRSLLFAPAVRPDLIRKMPATGADAVVIDCEDATPVAKKVDARATASSLVAEIGIEVATLVRINDIDTPWFEGDVAALPTDIAGIVLPKAESTSGLERALKSLQSAGLTQAKVVVGIETAVGVADARELLSHPLVGGAYFGAEDFVADMGGIRTADNTEVAFARSAVALAARIAAVPVIDQIVADFHDDARCRRECAEARSLGYVGKLCIHPSQVAIANDEFSPSVDEIDRARRLIAAYEKAAADGLAAIDFEGQMVDEPVANQARSLLGTMFR